MPNAHARIALPAPTRLGIAGTLAIILAVSAMMWSNLQNASRRVETMTPDEVYRLMRTDTTVLLLDVRTEDEWTSAAGHLRGAMLIPVQDLEGRIGELERGRTHTIVVYCRSGNRSGIATRLLRARGFRAFNMAGGMLRWDAERRPVIHEE